jgi:putative Mn2+ efflux pump MntP
MDLITIIIIALGLAMDAFAVSIVSGLTIKNLKISNAFKIAIFFGLFQVFMPVIGWLAALGFKDFTSSTAHWVAFGLLSFIGCKMIYESTKAESNIERNPLNTYVLLMLAVATSIDALAVGVSFALLKTAIMVPVIIIGVVTFLLSFSGVFIGNRFGRFAGNKIEIAGGIILIGIGIKILFEHW